MAAVVPISSSTIVPFSISLDSTDSPNNDTLLLNAVSATLPGQLIVASLMSDIAAVSLISALVMVPSEISDDSMVNPRSVTLPLSAESATLPAVLMVASLVSDMAATALMSTSVMVSSAIFPDVTAFDARLSVVTAPVAI